MPDDIPIKTTTGHVLVLGRGIRAFLAVIRSLGRKGLTVHVGMTSPNDQALKSRYVQHHHEIPEYKPNSTDWLNTILKLTDQYKFDLIIPTHDESAIPIQLHKEVLSAHAGIYALSDETFSIAFDKVKCSFLAEELGISIPRQMALPIDKLNCIAEYDFKLPLMIKPPSSYTSDDLGNRREVLAIRSKYQLSEFIKNNQSWGTALIQEIFEGRGVGVEVLAHEGKVLTAFQHLRIHEPISGGASSYRKSMPINPELLLASEKLLRHLNYTGVAMVEFKIDLASGKWIFIEINARFWGSLPLAIAAGADFPYFLYEMLALGKRNFSRDHQMGVYCRNLVRDLYWVADNVHDRLRSKPSPLSIPLHHLLLELGHAIRGKEHIDSFTLDDPRPGLNEISEFFKLFTGKIYSIIHKKIVNSYLFRLRKSRQLLTASKKSQSILFLCYGNICRSPFAEHYAKKVFPDSTQIKSSGFHTKGNRSAPSPAIDIAISFGIDTNQHRSSVISNSDIQAADIIFVFDQKNLDMLSDKSPQSVKKTHFLGSSLLDGNREIEDPYGEESDAFVLTFSRIIKAIDKIAPT